MSNNKLAATFHPEAAEQSVYLSIAQGERTHVVSVSREGHWPGRKLPHITQLIREVAEQAIADIEAAEAEPDPWSPKPPP